MLGNFCTFSERTGHGPAISGASLGRKNELAAKGKRGELTEAEKEEQKQLRAEYIAGFRASLRGTPDNTVIQRPDGSKEKLKKK